MKRFCWKCRRGKKSLDLAHTAILLGSLPLQRPNHRDSRRFSRPQTLGSEVWQSRNVHFLHGDFVQILGFEAVKPMMSLDITRPLVPHRTLRRLNARNVVPPGHGSTANDLSSGPASSPGTPSERHTSGSPKGGGQCDSGHQWYTPWIQKDRSGVILRKPIPF